MTATVLVVEDELKIRELVRRYLTEVQAVLRRSGTTTASDAPASFGAGTLVIDEGRHDLIVRGRPVELTPTERALLIGYRLGVHRDR